MLEQILKKESVNEQDIKILNANLHLLSEADKLRFGFITKEVITHTITEEDLELNPGLEEEVAVGDEIEIAPEAIVEVPKKKGRAPKKA